MQIQSTVNPVQSNAKTFNYTVNVHTGGYFLVCTQIRIYRVFKMSAFGTYYACFDSCTPLVSGYVRTHP